MIDWGDGSATTTLNVPAGTQAFDANHQYLDDNPTATASDPLTINVAVKDSRDRSVTNSVTLSLANVPPSLSGLNATAVGLAASLTGTISDPSASDSFTLQINWGDGSTVHTLVRPAGSTSFTATHDYQAEGTYSVSVTISDDDSGSSNAATALTIGSTESKTLSIDDVSVTEGTTGMAEAVFTVALSVPSLQTVTVSYATADDSATAGSDYVSNSGTLAFAPSEVSQQVRITVNGDMATEPAERFVVNLSSGSLTIADGQGIGTILNDDFDPNNDGALTSEDIIILLNHLFGNGQAPSGPAEADGVDGLSVTDVFAAINRLFF